MMLWTFGRFCTGVLVAALAVVATTQIPHAPASPSGAATPAPGPARGSSTGIEPVARGGESPPELAAALGGAAGLADSIPHPLDRVRFLLKLGLLQTRAGDRPAACATLGRAAALAEVRPEPRDGTDWPQDLCEVALAQGRNGDKAEARQSLDRAAALIATLPTIPQGYFWPRLLLVERLVGDRAAALPAVAGYERFLRALPPGTDFWGQPPIARLVALRAERGDFAGALGVVEGDAALWDKPETRAQALAGIAEALRPEDGVTVPATLTRVRDLMAAPGPGYQYRDALLVLRKAETTLGRFDEATATADQLLAQGRGYQYWTVDHVVMACASLARTLAEAGDHARSQDLVRRVLPYARENLGDQGKDLGEAIDTLATLTARNGEVDLALDLAESLANPDRFRALTNLARLLRERGRPDDARRAADLAAAACRRGLREQEAAPTDGPLGAASWAIRLAGVTGADADLAAARARAGALADPTRQVALGELAAALAESGRFAEARAAVDHLTDPKGRGAALLRVIEAELDRTRPETRVRWPLPDR